MVEIARIGLEKMGDGEYIARTELTGGFLSPN